MKIKLLIFTSFVCFGCSKVQPRRPINPIPSSTISKETVKKSIRLNALEDEIILAVIQKDSTKTYQVSPNGFWYTYLHKNEAATATPKTGDVVSLQYNITDLEGRVIYGKDEIGIKTYKVDQEDFIAALQVGIKLMKIGETITFVIPSYNAFGILGDGKKIGIHQSIKSTVTLININNKK